MGATAIPAVGMVITEYLSTPEWGTLAATSGSTLSGDGWSVTLAEGRIVPGTRPGDFEVVRTGK